MPNTQVWCYGLSTRITRSGPSIFPRPPHKTAVEETWPPVAECVPTVDKVELANFVHLAHAVVVVFPQVDVGELVDVVVAGHEQSLVTVELTVTETVSVDHWVSQTVLVEALAAGQVEGLGPADAPQPELAVRVRGKHLVWPKLGDT